MFPFWMSVLWVLLRLPSFSESDRCPISLHESSSPLLDSLLCYNNYKSYVHCQWREPTNMSVKLWFKMNKSSRTQCVEYSTPKWNTSEPGIAQCRYQTNVFAIGITHTVFFLEEGHRAALPAEALRTRPPVNLSTHEDEDGGCRVSWSEPYPRLSSLNEDVAYQLGYRRDEGDAWMTKNVSNTSMRLEKQLLLQGCRFQTRVRARVSVGQWSDWTPVGSEETEKDVGRWRPPSLHCVLVMEKEVKCSWEVSADVSQVVTHQLLCRRNRTAPTERCCENHSVNSDPGGRVLKHSCSLTATDPGNLLLELLPGHSAKTFKANKHIRPDPPEQLRVMEKGSNWVVTWVEPNKQAKIQVYYQLCYYRKDEECQDFHNVSKGTVSWNILQASLVPSQVYQVKVRSLVVPEDGAIYGGIPSELSLPATWTSHEAAWSPNTLIYCFIAMFVATVFYTIYCAVTACQRRVILWVDSIPSPGKSKIMSEIKVTERQSQALMKPSFTSKGQHFGSLSTCCTDVYLLPKKNIEENHSQEDSGWECSKQPFICDHSNGSGDFMGFSGLYILCWESKLNGIRDTPSSLENPAALNLTVGEQDYVCLPSRSTSGSPHHHLPHCDVGAAPPQENSGLHQCPPDPGQASGYCQLPTGHT
ncbi:hypothetical protein fugu_014867 [Takifugu bimaculatus]|uniref:Fibronectin type-III domain-containing protein n=1 Tax=Takifugu bimaculatus TaxID=433685 RepID=A0A4Z2BX04_9TELE|nr:hypothetical protein fugu_014867 [Takifugu bimaculatus]